jgi:hypoxanthine phosphoribosyltransferase
MDGALVIVPRDRIARRVEELARRIADSYPAGELTILGVMTGSLVFLADLIRCLPLRLRLSMVSVRSYPGTATRSKGPQFTMPLPSDLTGRHVLIVDDILDSGQTLGTLRDAVAARNPASLRTCVLLRKVRPGRDETALADFVGFDVADEFVVGYGLDYDDLYRNLPDICVLKSTPQEQRP